LVWGAASLEEFSAILELPKFVPKGEAQPEQLLTDNALTQTATNARRKPEESAIRNCNGNAS
jgi:hypothetical protein